MHPLRSASGSALLILVLVLSAIAMIATFTASGVFSYGQFAAISEKKMVDAELLADDLLEAGKFLLLYERTFYVDDLGPFNGSGTRNQDTRRLWGQNFGTVSKDSMDLIRACGGYNALGESLGTFLLNGRPVFCPLYLRTNLMSSSMVEQMYLEPSAGTLEPLVKTSSGSYVLKVPLLDRAKKIDNLTKGNQWLPLNIGQDILSHPEDFREVTLEYRFYNDVGNSSSSSGSQKLVEVKARVQMSLAGLERRPFERAESVILHPSTPRDFALFILYPARFDGTPTQAFSESVNLDAGSEIRGRVFFNGNIDLKLSQLPTFREQVVITGAFTGQKITTRADIKAFRNRFRKGLITGFSAPRYLYTGNCSTMAELYVTSQGNLPCRDDSTGGKMTIQAYLDSITNSCALCPVSANNATVTWECEGTPSDALGKGACADRKMIAGPIKRLTINGQYAFISAPVVRTVINAPVLYGTLFGGHVRSNGAVRIVSMAGIAVGDVGIPDQKTLDSFNTEYVKAYEGVSVPLVNLPITYSTKGMFQ